MTKTCKTCSIANLDEAIYCDKCGSKLESTIIGSERSLDVDADFIDKDVKLYPPTNVNRREREDFVEVVSTPPGILVEIIPEFKLEDPKGKNLMGFSNVNGYNFSEILNGTLRSYKKLIQYTIPMYLIISLISIVIARDLITDQFSFSSLFVSKTGNLIQNLEIMAFYKIISIIPTLIIFILIISFHINKKIQFKESIHNLIPLLPGFALLYYLILELYSLSLHFLANVEGTTWEIILNLILFLLAFFVSLFLSIGLAIYFVNNFMITWKKRINLFDAIKSGTSLGYKNLISVIAAFALIKSLGFGLNALLEQVLTGYSDFTANLLTAGVFTTLTIIVLGPIEPILIIIYYLLDLENKRILQGKIWTNKK